MGQEGLGKIRDQVIGHSVTLESTRAIYPLGTTHGVGLRVWVIGHHRVLSANSKWTMRDVLCSNPRDSFDAAMAKGITPAP